MYISKQTLKVQPTRACGFCILLEKYSYRSRFSIQVIIIYPLVLRGQSRNPSHQPRHISLFVPFFPNHPTQGPSFAQRMKPFEPRPTTPDIEHGSPRWPYSLGKSLSNLILAGASHSFLLCHELKPPRLRDPMILWFTHIFQGKIPKIIPCIHYIPCIPWTINIISQYSNHIPL